MSIRKLIVGDVMNLKELKDKVDFAFEKVENPEEVEVCITLVEPSIGGRAKMGVAFAVRGFDWESREFRIEPKEELVRKGRDLKTAIPIRERLSFDRSCKVYCCPTCDSKINKNDKFCRFCGQKSLER